MVSARSLSALAVIAGVTWATGSAVRRWWHEWGVDPLEATRPLPGDDLVPDAMAVDTRGIDIAARPEDVWPWLIQMGFGRAGWYSYDVVDMRGRSADRILPEFQELAEGDVVPTHPAGGFVVRGIDPGRSLVLYLDDGIAAAQAHASAAGASAAAGAATAAEPAIAPGDAMAAGEATPVNLRASGAFMASAMTRYAASWTFVLEPTPTGTRLIERFRVRLEGGSQLAPIAQPALGFGVFLMARRQLLGIRDRAEGRIADLGPAGGTAGEPETYVVAPEPLVAAPG